MSDFKLFHAQDENGITRYWRDNADGSSDILTTQDIEGDLDFNKAAYTHNDGYNADRTLQRRAHIPELVYQMWLNEGFDMLDPNNKAELRRRLNSSDYLFLRTAPGRL